MTTLLSRAGVNSRTPSPARRTRFDVPGRTGGYPDSIYLRRWVRRLAARHNDLLLTIASVRRSAGNTPG